MAVFSFGRNWKRYVKFILNEEILKNAQDSLLRYFGDEFDFKDKVFVDVGCGSGIFSLCALRLGCKKVISIDIDLQSIEATQMTKQKFLNVDGEWEILQGSILDNAFVESLRKNLGNEKVIVYSWGVLHHTGNLMLAMDNVMSLMQNGDSSGRGGGQLCLHRLI